MPPGGRGAAAARWRCSGGCREPFRGARRALWLRAAENGDKRPRPACLLVCLQAASYFWKVRVREANNAPQYAREESEPAAGGATSTPQAATTTGVRTRGGAGAPQRACRLAQQQRNPKQHEVRECLSQRGGEGERDTLCTRTLTGRRARARGGPTTPALLVAKDTPRRIYFTKMT